MNATQTSSVDLARFNAWARMIESDKRTSHNEKMVLKFRAWSHVATTRNMFSLNVELPKVY